MDSASNFGPDAYVVRLGPRGVLLPALGLAVWTAILFGRGHTPLGYLMLGVVELILLAMTVSQIRRVLRREVVFAVYRDGVYFGADETNPSEGTAWSQICAVELFTEASSYPRSQIVHRCLGVRARGTEQISRGGPAARPLHESTVRYLRDAGRLDLVPGADGTIRWAYRRMSGWRVSRPRLIAAVRRFAPQIPVIDGPNWPPVLTPGEAFSARRVRRRAS